MTDVPVAARTLTLLFTDVERSTEVVDRHGPAGVQALVAHHEIVRGVVEGEGGDLFERIGDAAYAALDDPGAALRAAVEIHRRLAGEDFVGIGPLRVRIAVDTGRVEQRDGRYLGRPLYRCARIQALARGGETLLSDETAGLVREALPDGYRLRDLGPQKLKGLAQRMRIWGLVPAAAAASRIRVLLVDDHEVVRRGLRGFLELLPDIEIVGEAGDGAEGVELAHRLAPDVVLMDLVMPTMDGQTAIGLLRERQPEGRGGGHHQLHRAGADRGRSGSRRRRPPQQGRRGGRGGGRGALGSGSLGSGSGLGRAARRRQDPHDRHERHHEQCDDQQLATHDQAHPPFLQGMVAPTWDQPRARRPGQHTQARNPRPLSSMPAAARGHVTVQTWPEAGAT